MATYTRPISAAFFASNLAGTLGYTVKSAAGATLIARTTDGIIEDGTSGVYSANVAGWNTTWTGSIRWDDGAGNVAVETFLAYAPGVLDNVPLKSDLLQAADVTAAAAAALPADFTDDLFDGPGTLSALAFTNSPAGSGGGGSGPTATQIADVILARPFPASPPANSIAGILVGLPTVDEYRAEIAGQIAATTAKLPSPAPSGYGGSIDASAVVTAINSAGVKLRADGLDLVIVEGSASPPINLRRGLSVVLAALLGDVTGADTDEVSIAAAGSNALRIRAVTDEAGNREVTLFLPN